LRPVVRSTFNIDDRPAILAVATDGPGERAGLQANDILLTINGVSVSESALSRTASDDGPQSYADVDRARSNLEAALKLGSTRVSVQRGARVLEAVVQPQPGCAYGNLGSSRQSLIKAESQADYVGLYLTARAGYDISGAGAFWRRLARDHGDPWYDRWDHPSAAARSRALDAAREEIAAKIKAGAPLIPNAGDGAN
jgi:hypothetical protein